MIYMFDIGQVVRLKSGGPSMTVTKNLPADEVEVTWFMGGKCHTEKFVSKALEKVDRKPDSGTVADWYDE